MASGIATTITSGIPLPKADSYQKSDRYAIFVSYRKPDVLRVVTEAVVR